MLFQSFDKLKILSHSFVSDIFVFHKINSTNQYFIENVSFLKRGDICLADSQTQGRGRYGKHWISPMSNNIYLSIYWYLYNSIKSVIELSLMAGVVIGEILQSLGVKDLQIKWPNDIYVQGRKLAGILVEVITQYDCYTHIVIGVGVNVTSFRFINQSILKQSYISLEDIGINLDRNLLAIKLINTLYQSLKKFERFGFMPFFPRWLILDHFMNQSARLFVGNQVIEGVFRGINSYGTLLLERSGLVYRYKYSSNVSLRF